MAAKKRAQTTAKATPRKGRAKTNVRPATSPDRRLAQARADADLLRAQMTHANALRDLALLVIDSSSADAAQSLVDRIDGAVAEMANRRGNRALKKLLEACDYARARAVAQFIRQLWDSKADLPDAGVLGLLAAHLAVPTERLVEAVAAALNIRLDTHKKGPLKAAQDAVGRATGLQPGYIDKADADAVEVEEEVLIRIATTPARERLLASAPSIAGGGIAARVLAASVSLKP